MRLRITGSLLACVAGAGVAVGALALEPAAAPAPVPAAASGHGHEGRVEQPGGYGSAPGAAGGGGGGDQAATDAWPPLLVDGELTLGKGLDRGTFKLVAGTSNGQQAKAGKWPLYRFAGDAKAGDVNGQGSGGVWFAVNAAGKLVKGAQAGPAAPHRAATDRPTGLKHGRAGGARGQRGSALARHACGPGRRGRRSRREGSRHADRTAGEGGSLPASPGGWLATADRAATTATRAASSSGAGSPRTTRSTGRPSPGRPSPSRS